MRLRSSRRPLVRRLAVLAVVGLAAAGLIAAIPSSANAADDPSAPAAACPTGAFAFTSELSNGSFKIGKNASSTGAKATACGTVTGDGAGGLLSVVKKENISFAPTTTKVLFLNLPTTVTPTSDLSGPTVLGAGGIDVTLSGSVLVTTKVLGQSCSFPLDLKMTTLKSGSLTGAALTADAATGAQTGKLVANEFTVPKWKSSKTCNAVVAAFTNGLLGLPLKAGASSAQFDISLKLGV